MWSASAFIPATRCAGMRSAARPANGAPGSCTAESMRPCFRRNRANTVSPTPSSRATATSCGRRSSRDCLAGQPATIYDAGRVSGEQFRVRALGPAAGGRLHVGLGADGPRLPEALLVLFRVANRRSGAALARGCSRRPRGRRAPAPRLPVHRPGGRQLLPSHARRSCAGAAAAPTSAIARTRVDSAASGSS